MILSATAAVLTAAAVTAQTPCGSTYYGQGAPGAGGISPTVAMTNLPLLGNASFALRADDVFGGSWTARVLGLASTSVNVLGVEVLVNAPTVVASVAQGTGIGGGQAVFALPLPNDPSFSGLQLHAQMVVLDPGAATGLAASEGMKLRLRPNNLLGATSAYQGGPASDAFSAIHYLGNGRIIAGRRSSQASNRFLLSLNRGATWQTVGCPGSTGAHTYFFGQNGATVFSGTGDSGNACLMKSTDSGSSWTVTLSTSQLRQLIGSTSARAVFSPIHLGNGHWLANVKSFDSRNSVIESTDNGQTWQVAAAQPGTGPSAWARQMIHTTNGVLLWPECLSDQLFRSTDRGTSWTPVTVPGASLFQPLCDAGNGVYLCGDATTAPSAPIRLYRSLDRGLTWSTVASVNLQRPTTTYWRDVIRAGDALYASACCNEGTSHERYMQLFRSVDDGATWCSLGNPYLGPHGGMQAIYQMCVTEQDEVFAACQPDSTIVRWSVPPGGR